MESTYKLGLASLSADTNIPIPVMFSANPSLVYSKEAAEGIFSACDRTEFEMLTYPKNYQFKLCNSDGKYTFAIE